MVYDTQERSATSGAPIECYKFIGSYNNYRFTSYQESVTVNGEVYTPLAISRSAVKLTAQDQTQQALEVILPYQNAMVQEYAYQSAPPSLDLELYRVHDTDYTDHVLLWSGKVTSFTVEGCIAKRKIPSVFDYLLQGNVPTPRHQAPCNHVFTDVRCGVPEITVSQNVTVTAIVGNIVTVSGLTFSVGEIKAGYIKTGSSERRMITDLIGTDITVAYPFANLAVNDIVEVVKGCDHSFTTCKNVYSNGVNFGGFPVVPNRNPFTSKI